MHSERSLFWDLFDPRQLKTVTTFRHCGQAAEAEDVVVGLVHGFMVQPHLVSRPNDPCEIDHVSPCGGLLPNRDRVPAIFIYLVMIIILTTNNIYLLHTGNCW